MVLEEVTIFQDFGPVIALIIIMVGGGRWILQKSFEQVEIARKDFTNYVQTTEKEHTRAMKESTDAMHEISLRLVDLSKGLNSHVKMKDEFIDTIERQRDTIESQSNTIEELFHMLKEQIRTEK